MGLAPRFKTVTRENVSNSLNKIRLLPKKLIRGLDLHYDNEGYYLIFPTAQYYLKRLWNAGLGSKYYSPKGIQKPLYESIVGHNTLLLIEGQINCASAISAASDLPCDYISPGGAADLLKPQLFKYYLPYAEIVIIVDKDATGVASAVTLQEILTSRGKKAYIYAMPMDLNDILSTYGKDAVHKEIKKILDLRGLWGKAKNLQAPREGTS